jgi:hypothetical protein
VTDFKAGSEPAFALLGRLQPDLGNVIPVEEGLPFARVETKEVQIY